MPLSKKEESVVDPVESLKKKTKDALMRDGRVELEVKDVKTKGNLRKI